MKRKQINIQEYTKFLHQIKETIHKQQLETLREVNRSLIDLYWQIGKEIVETQQRLGWGKSAVKKLSRDLQNEFPGIRGFSVPNLWHMRNFYLIILNKVKDPITREYYLKATRMYGWTSRVLAHQIENGSFERFALSDSTNFDKTLPEKVRKTAKLAVKDHYIFDFLEMGEDYQEKELEDQLIFHIQLNC